MTTNNLSFRRVAIMFDSYPQLNIQPSDCAGGGLVATATSAPSTRIPMATNELVALRLYISYDITITLDRTVVKANQYFDKMVSQSQLGDFTLNTMTANFNQLRFINASITSAPDFGDSHENPSGDYTLKISATLEVNNDVLNPLA